jgi:hypothetical protein
MNYEQLKADMEAGTQGDWEHDAPNLRVVSLPNRGVCALVYDTDGRRIARVPQLERIALAAPDLAEMLNAFIIAEVYYMDRNNLGDPELQHKVVWGRKALAAHREATK